MIERGEKLPPRRAQIPTQVITFNLGKAVLQGDAANNIELLAGDVVTVFSQKDIRVPVSRQTRVVSIEGEVGSPGVYKLQAGETLKSYVMAITGTNYYCICISAIVSRIRSG